ncbi:MAG: M20/M25/M40 family metallo-hydrolase [Oscillospiraceae bacterium]|nr:M20/M25/M40 family metallo-hydrolase [Oscillospiraceae bacterium]
MKAKESNAHFDSKVRECSNFTVREIKKICKEIGPRPAGEENEQKAQDYVENLMGGIADTVQRESFDVHPKAFMSWVLIDGIGMIIAAVLMILAHLNVIPQANTAFKAAAIVISAVALILLLGEFLFYKEFIDFLFPKRTSSNVICTRKAAGETKRRIIFAGHIDSAYEWRFTHLGGAKLLVTVIISSIGSLVLTLIMAVLSFFIDNGIPAIVMTVIQGLTIPAFIAVIFFVNWKVCVTGANDNLTGVMASMAVIKYLNDNNIRFENTEVVAVSTGCEECGLRGAKAFAKAHAKEYANDGTETVFMAVDTLHDYDYLGIYNKDMSGLVRLDNGATKMVKKATEICGLDIPFATVSVGSTDAAAGQQSGIKSVALAAMDPAPAKYYHTREDTAEILDMKTVETGLKIMLETAFLFDEQGLRNEY